MKEYVVINEGQTFFVPKFAVDTFLPDFVKGLEGYIKTQSVKAPHRQQSAYKVLVDNDFSKADEWLSALLTAPLLLYTSTEGTGNLGIGAFSKYFAKHWGFWNDSNPRDGIEATLRIIRTFFDATGLVIDRKHRKPSEVEERVDFELTELGKTIYPTLEIEMADEDYSKDYKPSLEPIQYLSAPWLSSTGDKHQKLQNEAVEAKLASQAEAASSVGFVIPSHIAQVYQDWFEVADIPVELAENRARFYKAKERSKAFNIRRMETSRRSVIQELSGVLAYYPVGFDRKARQYMIGYPLNPQGAKSERPLFYVVAPEAPKEKVLASLNAEGKELFGVHWDAASHLTHDELLNHNDDFIKQVCTTKGEPDLHKYTVLLEYAKQKEEV